MVAYSFELEYAYVKSFYDESKNIHTWHHLRSGAEIPLVHHPGLVVGGNHTHRARTCGMFEFALGALGIFPFKKILSIERESIIRNLATRA